MVGACASSRLCRSSFQTGGPRVDYRELRDNRRRTAQADTETSGSHGDVIIAEADRELGVTPPAGSGLAYTESPS